MDGKNWGAAVSSSLSRMARSQVWPSSVDLTSQMSLSSRGRSDGLAA